MKTCPGSKRKLKAINDVGLGYIKLGQQATTLSGGEAQRVKLATELSKVSTGKTMYILDEPTTGLHFEDVNILLGVLPNKLVGKGNTVIVVEHNLDVIKTADWAIDLGPEGRDEGKNYCRRHPGTDSEKQKKPYRRISKKGIGNKPIVLSYSFATISTHSPILNIIFRNIYYIK